MRIDPVERLAFWKAAETQAAERVKLWLKTGDKMSPGAIKRAADWHRMTVELVSGWTKTVDEQAKVAASKLAA